MVRKTPNLNPAMSIVLPASNEVALIGACLASVAASEWTNPQPIETIVIANGCQDDTADVARAMASEFAARGWALHVLEQREGGKLGALNTGDTQAQAGIRVYLDADVILAPALLTQLFDALNTDAPRYASGVVNITAPNNWISKAYARIYRQVPFMKDDVPGCGVFAVNSAGRARWGRFPDIISDDTFVRLSFGPNERVQVPASYDWPIVKGLSNLVKVRRRQNIGVAEIEHTYPELLANDSMRPFPSRRKLAMAVKDPVGFMVYAGVALLVKLFPNQSDRWSRGR